MDELWTMVVRHATEAEQQGTYARGSGPGLCDLLLCRYWFFFGSLDLIFLSFVVVFALFRPDHTLALLQLVGSS